MNPEPIVYVYARAFPKSDALQRPVAAKNRKGFPRHFGQTRVNKLVQENRIRLATWNIRTLTCKINITCLQETKRKGEKAKEIDEYKLWYTGKDNNRNSLGIIVDKDLKDKVVNVDRIGDKHLLIKLILKE
ncbi:hypothetical protein AMTRI_Chr12g271110 [Amborella trichopoda]